MNMIVYEVKNNASFLDRLIMNWWGIVLIICMCMGVIIYKISMVIIMILSVVVPIYYLIKLIGFIIA